MALLDKNRSAVFFRAKSTGSPCFEVAGLFETAIMMCLKHTKVFVKFEGLRTCLFDIGQPPYFACIFTDSFIAEKKKKKLSLPHNWMVNAFIHIPPGCTLRPGQN